MHDKAYEAFLKVLGQTPGLVGLWVENAYHHHNACAYTNEVENLYQIRDQLVESKASKAVQVAYLRVVYNCVKELVGDLTYEMPDEAILSTFPRSLTSD